MIVRIDKHGKVTIPKALRNKLNLHHGISLMVNEYEGKVVFKPAYICTACGKPLNDELSTRRACTECVPSEIICIY